MAMNAIVYGFKIRLVNVYSPTNTDGSTLQKDAFYRKVKKICISKEKHHKILVGGDFNAITDVVLSKSCYNGYQIIEDENCNDNGSRIKTFCRSQKLHMLQTYFEQKLEERYTWFSNDGITKRVLDYILAEEFVLQYVMNCKTEGTQDFGSDHRLVVMILNTPMCKKARWKPRKERRKCIKKELSCLDNPNTCK